MDVGGTGVLARGPWVTRRKLTVTDYHRMGDVGILSEDDRVELIEGELIAMAPSGSGHSGTAIALTHLLITAVGESGLVSVQNPIQLDDRTEPEPDFAVLKPRVDRYRLGTPRPDDVLLVIEIADSSLAYDRSVKRPLYARHGIPELWIVDLLANTVEICREPIGEDYISILLLGREGTVELVRLPGVVIPVAALFE